jgi:hypothetical protein
MAQFWPRGGRTLALTQKTLAEVPTAREIVTLGGLLTEEIGRQVVREDHRSSPNLRRLQSPSSNVLPQ